MADARAETPDTDEDMGLGNNMDLSPHSSLAMLSVPSSPVPDANGAPVPVSDSAAQADRRNPSPGPHGPLAGRQRANAGIPPLHPAAVLSKMSELPFRLASDFVSEVRGRYVVAPGIQAEGSESMELRVGMKRAASQISRSQYEIYNFSVKHSLSEAATDELLMLVGHVRVLHHRY